MTTQVSILTNILLERMRSAGHDGDYWFAKASEIIVFGSTAAGLARRNSDIDILIVGGPHCRVKTRDLDLIGISLTQAHSSRWLESELASHIQRYGVWVKGMPRWKDNVQLGPRAIHNKRQRIESFLTHLSGPWPTLEEDFRVKYSVKLRREAQRLALLTRGVAIPPTWVLDHKWKELHLSFHEVRAQLCRLSTNVDRPFFGDLLGRIDASF